MLFSRRRRKKADYAGTSIKKKWVFWQKNKCLTIEITKNKRERRMRHSKSTFVISTHKKMKMWKWEIFLLSNSGFFSHNFSYRWNGKESFWYYISGSFCVTFATSFYLDLNYDPFVGESLFPTIFKEYFWRMFCKFLFVTCRVRDGKTEE